MKALSKAPLAMLSFLRYVFVILLVFSSARPLVPPALLSPLAQPALWPLVLLTVAATFVAVLLRVLAVSFLVLLSLSSIDLTLATSTSLPPLPFS